MVVGDTGEGDASQHVLRDPLILAGLEPETRFPVVSSDVIYPSGALGDYEDKFYLPFKGFRHPIYAIPGNHDWYDGLEGFTANLFEAEAAARDQERRSHEEPGQQYQAHSAPTMRGWKHFSQREASRLPLHHLAKATRNPLDVFRVGG